MSPLRSWGAVDKFMTLGESGCVAGKSEEKPCGTNFT